MKRKVVIGALIFAFIGIFAFFAFDQIVPEEIENAPDWLTLQEAMEMSEDDNRLILVDIYEVGCRFCRQMEREVYPSQTIRAILDRDFHPVKVNGNSENVLKFLGEEMQEKDFASKMGVTAFPFTVVLDPEGNVLDRRRGYMDIQSLSRFLRDAHQEKS